ncbi:hypothetical protein ABPG72_001186 [Tetrahymena utriculariae]
MDPVLKQLKIKSGAVKRLQKEYVCYQHEEQKQKEKLEQMKQQGVDDYEIKKMTEFLEETQAVFPGCRTRLQDTLNEFTSWMNENGNNLAINDTQEKAEAEEIIQQATQFLEQLNALN